MKHLLLIALTALLHSVASQEEEGLTGIGARQIGDYRLNVLTIPPNSFPPNNIFSYPESSATSIQLPNQAEPFIRPEVITYIACYDYNDTTYTGPWGVTEGGPGSTYYKTELLGTAASYTLVTYGKPPTMSFTKGTLAKEDSLLHVEVFTKPAIPNKIIALTMKYPKRGVNTATLTWLGVQDNNNNDTASVKVIKGGVGYKSVKLEMRSRVGESLNFVVQMFGKNYTTDNWPWYLSVDAHLENLMFDYWSWSLVDVPMKKEITCGCRSGKPIK